MMNAMPGAKRGLPVGVGTLAVAAACGLLAAKLLVSPAPSGEGLVEVGEMGTRLHRRGPGRRSRVDRGLLVAGAADPGLAPLLGGGLPGTRVGSSFQGSLAIDLS